MFRTGEGVFEVQRRRQKQSEDVEDEKKRTAAEEKMEKTLKKMQRSSRMAGWSEWGSSGRVRVKGRRWEDVSVPGWMRNCETDMRQ